MKLSLRWIFDHITGNWQDIDVARLVNSFNSTTAAIENYEHVTLDLSKHAIGIVKKINDTAITVFCLEWHQTLELPPRSDATLKSTFLIKANQDGQICWATLADCGAQTKDGLMPAIFCPKRLHMGEWKKNIETSDYILDLDNPSITHRPDLWGARGIARECAAILGLKLKAAHKFLEDIQAVSSEKLRYSAPDENQFSIDNQAPNACTRYAGLSISDISAHACSLPLAFRLCRVDHRPINILVDAANYTMLDWGQPLHTFDTAKISSKTIAIRMAHQDEKLKLLDETTLKLVPSDLVIADETKAIALAGIMGGTNTGVSQSTKTVFIESAHFNSAFIRMSSGMHHVRTDASACFEKGLDPNQIEDAIKRMLKLLTQAKINYKQVGPLAVVGAPMAPYKITVSHEMIEARLGKELSAKQILSVLRSIDFIVEKKKNNYHIQVPTFRGTHGVTIPEDIVDEVGRLIGLDSIEPKLPHGSMRPHANPAISRLRMLKQQLAFASNMHEVRNYPFFDESFLQEINWHPANAIKAKNPLSLNVTQLVTSLVPHLLMNIEQNKHKQDTLNFFECNRTWHLDKNREPREQQSCTGIMWHTKKPVDFYTGKQHLLSFFNALNVPVQWKKVSTAPAAWYNPNQTAELVCYDKIIGYAGTSNNAFTQNNLPGAGFIFELDLELLTTTIKPPIAFVPLSKYPYVYLDISMLASLETTVESLEKLIKSASSTIYNVALVDMFYKDEWQDKRSLTFRYYLRDPERTLTKEDIEMVSNQVHNLVAKSGAQIR